MDGGPSEAGSGSWPGGLGRARSGGLRAGDPSLLMMKGDGLDPGPAVWSRKVAYRRGRLREGSQSQGNLGSVGWREEMMDDGRQGPTLVACRSQGSGGGGVGRQQGLVGEF